jgi:hypothetical protein
VHAALQLYELVGSLGAPLPTGQDLFDIARGIRKKKIGAIRIRLSLSRSLRGGSCPP